MKIQNNTGNRLLVIADYHFDRNIIDALKKKHHIESVGYIEKPLGQFTGYRVLYRQFSYLLLAMKGYFSYRIKKHTFVIIWQQYIGFYFSLFSILDVSRYFRNMRSKIILFYILPKRKTISRMAEIIYDLGVIYRIVYFSREDYDQSHCRKKLLFYYIQKRLDATAIKACENIRIEETPYVFAGGTSNRDYAQIAELGKKFGNNKFIIACREQDIAGLDLSENTKIYHNKIGDDFLSLIYHSYFGIIPLKYIHTTSGKIILLRTLEFGKPVLVNLRFDLLKEWLGINGKKGVIYYKNQDELISITRSLLTDKAYYEENVRSAKAIFEKANDYKLWVKRFVELYDIV